MQGFTLADSNSLPHRTFHTRLRVDWEVICSGAWTRVEEHARRATPSPARRLLSWSFAASVLLAAAAPALAATLPIQEVHLTGNLGPAAIAAGPDGNVWFTTLFGNAVLRVDTAGILNGTFFVVPGTLGSTVPIGITTGSDSNVWVAEAAGDLVEKFTPGGSTASFQLPRGAHPTDITPGPDGSLWFTESKHDLIGRITTSGVLTGFPLATGAQPIAIVAGPDGALWFTELGTGEIGRLTTKGALVEFLLPRPGSRPRTLVVGPDNNLWFTELSGNRIGRITIAGAVTEFPVPTAGAGPTDLVAGPDGNLWFTEGTANQIAVITPQGGITEFKVPTADAGPAGIAVGPDGAIWFTETKANQIARVVPQPGPACSPSATTLCLDDQPGDGRWQLGVSFISRVGAANGEAIGLSSLGVTHGGLFWFFAPGNPEVLIKVLNGCGVNQNFWVFYAAATNVGFTISVRDTLTGFVKLYSNPLDKAALAVQDTAAEGCSSDRSSPASVGDQLAAWAGDVRTWLPQAGSRPPAPTPTGGGERSVVAASFCTTTATALCIGGRFLVTVTFATLSLHGAGTAVDLSGLGVTQGGLFWFFTAENPEVLVKVLDECAFNNHYWVFLSATTNAGFTVTVKDVVTGAEQLYFNQNGTAAPPVQDTSALPCG